MLHFVTPTATPSLDDDNGLWNTRIELSQTVGSQVITGLIIGQLKALVIDVGA